MKRLGEKNCFIESLRGRVVLFSLSVMFAPYSDAAGVCAPCPTPCTCSLLAGSQVEECEVTCTGVGLTEAPDDKNLPPADRIAILYVVT